MKKVYSSLDGMFSAFSCKKDSFNKLNSKRIGNALMHFYPFFILHRELMGISAKCRKPPCTIPCPEALVRRLLCQRSDILSYVNGKLVIDLIANTH